MNTVPESVLAKLNDLAVMPHVAQQVIDLLRDENVTARDIQDAVYRDEALTSALLKTANSAYYSTIRRITTIRDAVVILGLSTVRNLVIAYSTKNMYFDAKSLVSKKLWEHAQFVAFVSRSIAKMRKYPVPEEAFVAGLLHDFGKTFMYQMFQKEYELVLTDVYDLKQSFAEPELRILGYTHADVGREIAIKWKFSDALIDGIRFHHDMAAAAESPLAVYINVADALAYHLGFGLYQAPQDFMALESARTLGLTGADIEAITQEADTAHKNGELLFD